MFFFKDILICQIEIPEPTQRIPRVHIWMHPIMQTSEFSLVCNLMKYKNILISITTYISAYMPLLSKRVNPIKRSPEATSLA